MAVEKDIVIFEIDAKGLAAQTATAVSDLNVLKRTYAELTEEIGENTEQSKLMEAQIAAQSKQVKQLEGALLRVTQAEKALGKDIKEIAKDYDAANNSIDNNRKVLNALTQEYNKSDAVQREKLAPTLRKISDELKKQEGAIGDTRRNVGNYKQAIVESIGGLQFMGKSVSGLIDPLKNMGIGFDSASGAVTGLGGAMKAIPIFAIITGVQQLINVFSSFEPIVEGLEDAMGGLSSVFSVGYEKGVQLVQLRRELEQADRDSLITNAQYRNQISELEAKSKDKTADPIARANALKEANKIREEQLKFERDLNKKHLDEMLQQSAKEIASAANKAQLLRGTPLSLLFDINDIKASKETLDKLAELRAKDIDLQTAQREQIIENQNKVAQFEQDSEEKNAVKKVQLRREALKDLQPILDAETKAKNDALDKQAEAEIKAQLDREKRTEEGHQKAADKRREQLEAEEEHQRQLVEQADKLAKQTAEKQNATLNNILGFMANTFAQASSLVTAFAEQNIEALHEQYRAGAITQKQFEAQSKELKLKAFRETKALKITESIITTAQATLNAFNSGLQAGGPFGIVLGAIFAAAALAFGIAQTALIARQQPPKYAGGGAVVNVGGREHAQGGTKYQGEDGNVFEVEKGEGIFVMKKTAYSDIDKLGKWNMLYGGKSWTDSPVRFAADGGAIQDGGFVARNTSLRADEMAFTQAIIKETLKNIPAPVVSVVEINKVNSARNRSVGVSEL